MNEDQQALLRAAFAPARALEPSDALVAEALNRVLPPAGRRPRPAAFLRRALVPALAALTILAAGVWAVPATRAALRDAADEIADVFGGWTGGGPGGAPGRALQPGDGAPAYLYEGAGALRHVHEPRILAQAGGYELYAYRERSGAFGFDLGATGVGMGGLTAADFRDRALYVLGPGAMSGPDVHGHIPWFGLAARSVARIEVTYESGPPLRVEPVNGAFVLLVEPRRGPREVIAFDSDGKVLASDSIAYAY